VGTFRHRRHEQAPVHVGVAPGFVHQRRAVAIQMFAGVAAPREDRTAARLWIPRRDNPQRLALRMGVNDRDALR